MIAGRRVAAAVLTAALAFALPVRAEMTLRIAAQQMPLYQALPYNAVAQPQALFAQMIYDPLTQVGEGGVAQPWLAESWTQEAPNKWVFKLRAGITFSNGERFTAKAVTDALAYLATPEGELDSLANQNIAKTIAEAKVRDELTVEITTREPDPILPLHLSFVRVPAPEAFKREGRQGFMTKPIGTGPFVVTSWATARVSLKARTDGWRKPKADAIDVSLVPDPVARVQAFASNAVDIAFSISPDDRTTIEDASGTLYERAEPNVRFVAFVTTKTSPLQDPRVRQALNYAVDKTALIAAFQIKSQPASQFSHGGAFGFDPTLQPYPYDPAKARALLKAAGYANGFAFAAVLDSSRAGVTALYQQIAQDLAKIGVNMTVRSMPITRITDFVKNGGWPVEAFDMTFAGFDSLRGYNFRSCALHNAYTCDKVLMPMIATAQTAPNEAARRTATQAVLAAERENPPGIMMWRLVDFDALRKTVRGFAATNDFIAWDNVTLGP